MVRADLRNSKTEDALEKQPRLGVASLRSTPEFLVEWLDRSSRHRPAAQGGNRATVRSRACDGDAGFASASVFQLRASSHVRFRVPAGHYGQDGDNSQRPCAAA